MHLIFGLALDGPAYPQLPPVSAGTYQLGKSGLLRLLESQLALAGHTDDNAYLRIEVFRQALRLHLETHPTAFYQASFQADPFATAAALLERRDELRLAGWDFQSIPTLPPRLATLAELEGLFTQGTLQLPAGFADRLLSVWKALQNQPHPIQTIQLVEPIEFLPYYLQSFLKDLCQSPHCSCRLIPATTAQPQANDSDLGQVQAALLEPARKEKRMLRGDGSLVLFETPSSTDAAGYLAMLLRKNPAFRPLLLIPEKFPALDNAFMEAGLPSMGIQSASLARPSLQLLKLAPAFLWKPIDPYKILEFVNLAVKPLEQGLADVIANEIAQRPGIQGEAWYRAIYRFLDRLGSENSKPYQKIKSQYEFWFERRRYEQDTAVPKPEVLELFNYLQEWARNTYEENENGPFQSLRVLSEQARKITEMLLALPEEQLSYLELERIVRTIYEPSSIILKETQVGYLPFFHEPGAIYGPTHDLIWWNFIQNDPPFYFSKWYQAELLFLNTNGIQLEPPHREHQRALWQRIQPFLQTQKRLILVLPATVNGETATPHPLLGDLEAFFDNLHLVRIPLQTAASKPRLFPGLALPHYLPLTFQHLGTPQAFIQSSKLQESFRREQETYSSLQDLFYYPYKWVFRHRLRLRKSSLLSVTPEETLMGNLAHRLFERLFQQEKPTTWSKTQLESWVEEEMNYLLEKEGSVFLMYGREPERIGFLNRLKFATWSLLNLLRENNWQIKGSEAYLEGKLGACKVVGIADLILERGEQQAIIDLKWRGAGWRQQLLKNEEDLQLILYSNMLREQKTTSWPYSAYFIINKGTMIARNHDAFQQAIAVAPNADANEVNDRIWERMQKTLAWRSEQLNQGLIEVRCTPTVPMLEEYYAEVNTDLLEFLEMKEESAHYDDYSTLINLLE